jgi:hypothetical protein
MIFVPLPRWVGPTARELYQYAADLGQKLSGEVSKSSAIEFSHSTANAMTDLSLGQGV